MKMYCITAMINACFRVFNRKLLLNCKNNKICWFWNLLPTGIFKHLMLYISGKQSIFRYILNTSSRTSWSLKKRVKNGHHVLFPRIQNSQKAQFRFCTRIASKDGMYMINPKSISDASALNPMKASKLIAKRETVHHWSRFWHVLHFVSWTERH